MGLCGKVTMLDASEQQEKSEKTILLLTSELILVGAVPADHSGHVV